MQNITPHLTKPGSTYRPCDDKMYKDDGTVKVGDSEPSMTPPGLPTSDKPGHLGSPITGASGKGTKRPTSWADNVY
jgi:hypothetical protein